MSKTERMEKMNRPLKKSDWIVCSLRIVLNNAFRTGVCGRSFWAEEPAVSISINDFTEPHPLPTLDPDYVEISLEEYLERLANGEIFEDPSGDEKELALYASTGWEQVSGK